MALFGVEQILFAPDQCLDGQGETLPPGHSLLLDPDGRLQSVVGLAYRNNPLLQRREFRLFLLDAVQKTAPLRRINALLQAAECFLERCRGMAPLLQKAVIRQQEKSAKGSHVLIGSSLQFFGVFQIVDIDVEQAILAGDDCLERVDGYRRGEDRQSDHDCEAGGYIFLKSPRTDHCFFSLAGSAIPARWLIASVIPGISNTARTADPIQIGKRRVGKECRSRWS